MAKKNSTSLEEQNVLKLLEALKPYVANVSAGKMLKGRFFSNCIRASFAICYEFNLHAWNEANSDSAYFWLPALRGVCENLIVLNYIKGISALDRENLVALLMSQEVQTRLTTQATFFKAARPFQPHLQPRLSREEIAKLESKIHDIWKSNGWPNMNRGSIPPTRQLAEKKGGLILEALYDYLYRLTSGTVHFNVSGLLRTGWGDKPNCTFSASNFSGYYTAFGRVYGAYMLCCFFELFASFLRTNNEEKDLVRKIRKSILQLPRWPEMITFEEMNVEPPQMEILQLVSAFVHAETQSKLLVAK